MSKKNGNKFDSLKKVEKNTVYRNGKVDVYCNNCGKINGRDGDKCPDCGSEKIVYLEGDNNADK